MAALVAVQHTETQDMTCTCTLILAPILLVLAGCDNDGNDEDPYKMGMERPCGPLQQCGRPLCIGPCGP